MMFLDQAKIHLRSGWGGDGAVSFRREKFLEFGGPDGGDGGRGGDIAALGVAGLNTLIDFRYRQHHRAGRGGHGMGRQRTGAAGEDLVIPVPVGTEIRADDERRTLIADIRAAGQRVVLARGGQGGRGNSFFKSSTNRAPRRFQKGGEGVEFSVWLRLKLIADAGLVGLPNAGKSSLLNALTAAHARVGDYPFTTLTPQLGVVRRHGQSFVLADIPGIIEGAAEGRGIGDRFLGHVERTRLLVHVVDLAADDPAVVWRTVRAELGAYGAGLEAKTELLVATKADLVEGDARAARLAALAAAAGAEPLAVSAMSGEGLAALSAAIARHLRPPSASPAGDRADAWSPL